MTEGNGVGMSQRDMLLEMYDDLKVIRSWMDETRPQNLPVRVDRLESWRDRLAGLASVGTLLAILATLIGLLNGAGVSAAR